MPYSAFVATLSIACVSEVCKLHMFEWFKGLLCCSFENNNLECTHEKCRVCALGAVGGCVVIQMRFLKIFLRKQFFQFSDVLPGFAKAEGAEVCVEWLIDEVLNRHLLTLSMQKYMEFFKFFGCSVSDIQ